MGNVAPPFNFQRWISDHRHLLQPPVCNKQVFEQDDFIVMVVGGPNGRRDYHYEEGPELFYQLEGKLLLKTLQDGKSVDYPLEAGDIFLLPPKVPHSPVRFENSIGLVVERKRLPHEQDGLMWFCESCDTKLYEEYFHLNDVEKDFLPVFDRFLASEAYRTCKNCGTVMPASNRL